MLVKRSSGSVSGIQQRLHALHALHNHHLGHTLYFPQATLPKKYVNSGCCVPTFAVAGEVKRFSTSPHGPAAASWQADMTAANSGPKPRLYPR